jgi:hypothetical protein
MKLKNRFYVLVSSFTWAVIGLYFTGSLLFFLLPLIAFGYMLIGGKKHV